MTLAPLCLHFFVPSIEQSIEETIMPRSSVFQVEETTPIISEEVVIEETPSISYEPQIVVEEVSIPSSTSTTPISEEVVIEPVKEEITYLPPDTETISEEEVEEEIIEEIPISEEVEEVEEVLEEPSIEAPEEFVILAQGSSNYLAEYFQILANAGEDFSVLENDVVLLNAHTSPGAVSYAWSCTMDSNPINLDNANTRVASFRAPLLTEEKQINCNLKVTDLFYENIFEEDNLIITVNNGPVANAGVDKVVNEAETVYLVSSSIGAGLLYSWQCDNTDVIIQNKNTSTAFFSAPFVLEDTIFACRLTVRDLGGEIQTDELNVTIKNGPIAISQGDIQVNEGGNINLNGLSSIGAITSYAWSCNNNFPSIQTNQGSYYIQAPEVNENTIYACTLNITDMLGETSENNFTINVLNIEEVYSKPQVYFNPYERSVIEGLEVTLNPTVISETEVFDYSWSCTFNGNPLTLSNSSAKNPNVIIPAVNTSNQKVYCNISATNTGGTSSATQTLKIINGPTANAGSNQTVYENKLVTLSGRHTGNITSVSWECDNDINLTNEATLTPSFTTPFVLNNTLITCALTITDFEDKTATDTVAISIVNGPLAIVSNLIIEEGNIASISNTSIGDLTSYLFNCEDNNAFTINNLTLKNPTVTALNALENTTVSCSLTITDSEDQTDEAAFTITVLNHTEEQVTTPPSEPIAPTEPVILEDENPGQQEEGGGFVATIENGTITLVWEKGLGTTHTYIKRAQGEAPASRDLGDLIYFNTGEYTQDPGLPLGETYCYSAWGYNATSDIYSTEYASVCILVDLNIVSVEGYLLGTTKYIRANINTVGLLGDLNLRYKKTSDTLWTNLEEKADISSGIYTFELNGLEPGGVSYDFEVILTSGENTRTYSDSFISEVVIPTISNASVNSINAESGVLTFDLDNGGALTDVTIEYADNIDFTDSTIITKEDKLTSTINENITNLIQETTYYYKIQGENEKGLSNLAQGNFTTESIMKNISAINILTKSVQINFYLNTNNTSNTVLIEYADNIDFTDSTTTTLLDQTHGEGSQVLDNLTSNTTYYYKITAEGKTYPNEAEVYSFETLDINASVLGASLSRLSSKTLEATITPEQDYTYLWSCDGIELTNGTTASPSFTAPDVLEDTAYNCSLTVSDNFNEKQTNFTVTVIAIEEGWISVPGDDDYGTPDFLVMKYEAKNVDNIATSQADVTPWVSITQIDAKAKCEAINAHLITNEEWMTIARNIEANPVNWTGGSVGQGMIKRGNVGIPDDGSYDGADPEFGFDRNTKAKLQLSNGEEIWDVSGNVWEWVDETLLTSELPNYAATWREINSITYTSYLPYSMVGPLNESFTSVNGIGKIYTDNNDAHPSGSIHAFRRGGAWSISSLAGVFTVDLGYAPEGMYTNIGFRCAKTLVPTISNASILNIKSKSADLSFTLANGETDTSNATITYANNSEYTNPQTINLSNQIAGTINQSLSNLVPETTYYYKISSTNTKGTSNTIEGSFTTEAIVKNVSVSNILTSTTNIVFDLNTSEANITLEYADNIEFTNSNTVTLNNQSEGQVTIPLSNLIENTSYYYNLSIVDIDNYTYSHQDTFTTQTISLTVSDFSVGVDTELTLSATITPAQTYTYLWSCDGGALSNEATATPTFISNTADATYNCSLSVSDGVNAKQQGIMISVIDQSLEMISCNGCISFVPDASDEEDYNYIKFINIGEASITFSGKGYIDFLVVAGGGGGGKGGEGDAWAGGGGAGGLIFEEQHLVQDETIPIFVGAGGALASSRSARGQSGQNSSLSDFIAIGGGAGGSGWYNQSALWNGLDGGSGGGGAQYSSSGGNGTLTQGNSGHGNCPEVSGGGGGGGAGGPALGVLGGSGLSIPIFGDTVYAKGGNSKEAQHWGSGSAWANVPNSGNGGDAGTKDGWGSSGASGIVIIKYPKQGGIATNNNIEGDYFASTTSLITTESIENQLASLTLINNVSLLILILIIGIVGFIKL